MSVLRRNQSLESECRIPNQNLQIKKKTIQKDGYEDRRVTFPCYNPAEPNMQNVQSRLQTFSTWRTENTNSPPEALAYAGFRYLGRRDKLKCFYCGGGLENWDYYDDPWVEHAKWYPNCEYLLQQKGPEFVSDITSRFPDIDRVSVAPPSFGLDIPPVPEPTRHPILPQQPLHPTLPEQPRQPVAPEPPRQPIRPAPMQNAWNSSQQSVFGSNFPFGNIEMNGEESSISINNGQIRIIGGSGVTVTRNGDQTIITRAGNNTNGSSSSQDVKRSLLEMGYSDNEIDIVLERLRSRNIVPDVLAALDEMRITSGEAQRYVPQEEDNQNPTSSIAGPCVVCLENAKEMVMVPCGHFCSCRTCASRLQRCPICRANVDRIVRVFT